MKQNIIFRCEDCPYMRKGVMGHMCSLIPRYLPIMKTEIPKDSPLEEYKEEKG